ncbi:MAG: tetraacyldisaccharide 4'-kinase [Rhodospirillaceae bacterium]|nr:tetraacyldisaccharide 4'-kinase [Rhodospirillaceae bacterium]HAA93321.1 tetraacyldisaccharide 4'-kinase [Rhodospirillaceae bacterium]
MRAPDFWKRRGMVSACLQPASWIVTQCARRRQKSARPVPAPVPVICVGNLTVGGAGKTPVALAVEARLKAKEISASFLSRGYGGRLKGPVQVKHDQHSVADVGDEPLLLARQAPCIVSADRPAGANAAVAAGAQAIVMDDGFQNHSLEKSLSLIVVDGGYGFGNGRVMPAGPLREPVEEGLARADAVVVIGPPDFEIRTDKPVFRARLQPLRGEDFSGRPVIAFAGIGRPDKFFDTLRSLGADVVAEHAFPDHHRYRARDFEAILKQAAQSGDMVVTTEKDAVRLPPSLAEAVVTLPVELVWEDSNAIDALLDRVI